MASGLDFWIIIVGILILAWRHGLFGFMNPNSQSGLVSRARSMEKDAEKMDGEQRESYLRYARLLREIALKNWTPAQSRAFIKENMRQGSRFATSMPMPYITIVQIIVGIITFWWSWNYITRLIEEAGTSFG